MTKTTFLDRGWVVRTLCSRYENLVCLAGRRWKERRSLANPSFSLDVIQSFLPTVIKNIGILIEDIVSKNGESFDFHELVINHVVSIILETSIGFEESSNWSEKRMAHEEVKKWFASQIDRIGKPHLWLDPINDLFELINGKQASRKDFISRFSDVIKVRMEQNGQYDVNQYYDDGKMKKKPFLSHMIDEYTNQARSKKPTISYDELLIETVAIAIASYETVSNTLTWTLFFVASNLNIQEKLYQELTDFDNAQDISIKYLDSYAYLDQCIMENLRLRPPLSSTVREIEHSITLDGFEFPKKTMMVISIFAVHHDETIYPNPEVFDPDRFTPENKAKIPLGGYIPFGEGPRKCIGWKLALVVTKVILAHIVKKFVISVENPENVKARNDVFTRSTEPIMLRFTPRH